MIDHLEVTPLRLQTAAKNIAAAGKDIEEILDVLRTEATALGGRWSGEAREAYLAAQATFDKNLAGRTALLVRMTDALNALSEAYSEADLGGARALGVTS